MILLAEEYCQICELILGIIFHIPFKNSYDFLFIPQVFKFSYLLNLLNCFLFSLFVLNVSLMEAKYFPRGTLWHNSRTQQCTLLWKAMMQSRPLLAPHLQWCIGNGMKCQLYSQSWFTRWQQLGIPPRHMQHVTLAQLYNLTTSFWDLASIQNLPDDSQRQVLLDELMPMTLALSVEDRIMFTYARTGDFSIKKTYQMLTLLQPVVRFNPSDQERTLLKNIWHVPDITPPVKIFL